MCLVSKKLKENEKKWVEREGKKKIIGDGPRWGPKRPEPQKKKILVVNFPKKQKKDLDSEPSH